ncbi:MAG: hypothetical protein II840_11825 [Kiritimatiellae bacterium]|nr:hypothetical protein [Kiritimatiellia bacterium]
MKTPTKRATRRLAASLAIITALVATSAHAAEAFFTGAEDNYFKTAGNWDINAKPTSQTTFFQASKFNSRFTENEVVFDDAFSISAQFSVRAVGTAENPLVWRATAPANGLKSTASNSLIGWNTGDAYLIISNGTWQVAGSALEIGTTYKGWLYLKDINSFTVSGNNNKIKIDNGSTLILDGGTVSVGNNMELGGSVANKSATYIQKNGTLTVSGDIYLGRNSSSTSGDLYFELGGGTVTAGAIAHGAGTAPAKVKFDGGTLKQSASNPYANGVLQYNAKLTAVVGSKGGTIDSNNKAIYIGASIGNADGEVGGMRFKGGSTITFKDTATPTYTGGTTVELGTKIVASTAAVKAGIIDNGLKVEYGKVLTDDDYTVFEYSGGLTADDLAKVTLVDCGVDTTVGFNDPENPTAIVVHFVAPKWISDTESIRVWTGSLNDIAFGTFTCRFGGRSSSYSTYAATPNSATGYNKKLYVDGNGSVTNAVVEYQVLEETIIKCVIVSFTNGVDGVYATALDAKYIANQSYVGGFEFYKQSRTWANGISDYTVVTSNDAWGYGVYDLRVTDTTASLTVTGGKYVFAGEGDAGCLVTASQPLEVTSGSTMEIDSVSGPSSVVNNGTIVLKGRREVSITFDKTSTGTYIVSNGILKATGVAGSGTSQTIRVKSGATFDVNGCIDLNVNIVLENGSHFANASTTAVQWNQSQAVSLALDGDATATATRNFGLVAPNHGETTLGLDTHTFTIDGANNFIMANTTVAGTGKVVANCNTLVFYKGARGDDWSLEIGEGKNMWLYNGGKAVRCDVTVGNFWNRGTINTSDTTGTLTVKGVLTTGNAIPDLALADGATVKATGTAQVVSTKFSATGAYTIDASAITKAQLDDAEKQRIAVLTVPTSQKGGTWTVANPPVDGCRAKWVDNDDGTSTLYLCKSHGPIFIIR